MKPGSLKRPAPRERARSQPEEDGGGSSTPGRTAILVAGMHRSGTSALTRVISLQGADLAAELVPAKDNDNPSGFWEPMELVNLSEELLVGLGQSWMALQRLKTGWESSPAAERFKAGFGAFIEREFSSSELFVLKDPRLCRILPLVSSTLRELQITPKVVICYRNPYEVAASLHRRQAFPPSKGCALWLRHVLDAELSSRPLPRTFISYDALIEDARAVLAKISDELDVRWPAGDSRSIMRAEEFLRRNLRHYNFGMQVERHPWINETFELLEGLSRHPGHGRNLRRLDGVRQKLSTQDDFLLDVLWHDNRWAWAERTAKLELQEELRAKEATIAENSERLENLKINIAKINAWDSAKESELEALRSELALRTHDDAALRDRLAELEAELAGARGSLGERETELETARKLLEAGEAAEAAMRERLHADGERAEAQGKALERCQSRIQLVRERLRAESERTDARRGEVERLEGRVRELADQYNTALRSLDAARSENLDAHVALAGMLRRQRLALRLLEPQASLGLTLAMPAAPISAQERGLMGMVRESSLFEPEWYSRYFTVNRLPLPCDPLLHFVRFGMALGLDPSPLFDTVYYVRHNLDADFSLLPPFLHFLVVGGFEGRDPNPLFDIEYYLGENPAIETFENPLRNWVSGVGGISGLADKTNPLVHYAVAGAAGGGSPSPYFDQAFYCRAYGVAPDGVQTPLAHFLSVGLDEGHNPNPLFDTAYYLKRHPEVGESGVNPVEHFQEIGAANGYKPHPYFDPKYYLETYEDVRKAGLNPLAHFLKNGLYERRKPNPLFDPDFYLSFYSDIDPESVNPFEHYLEFGAKELRRPHPDFFPDYYLDAYSDLQESGCDPLAHFLDHGAIEGRRPNDWFDAEAYRFGRGEPDDCLMPPFLHYLKHGPRQDEQGEPALAVAERLGDLPWRHEGLKPAPGGTYFRIVFVSHIANRTGAPLCILRLLEELAHVPGIECRVLVHEDGELTPFFARLAPTLVMDDLPGLGADGRAELVARLFRREATRCLAVANTVASASYAEAFWKWDVPVLAWLHELPTSIEAFSQGAVTMARIDLAARHILCPSDFVKQRLVASYSLEPSKLTALHNGTELPPEGLDRADLRRLVREEFALPPDARIVLGCGTVDMRKGVDLFVRAAHALASAHPERAERTWFVWVGDPYDAQYRKWLEHDAARLGVAGRLILAGPRVNPGLYFAAADVFALTSREDPFPMVNMEALSYGLPVVAFDEAGGAREMLGEGRGVVVPYGDVAAMASAIEGLLAARSGMGGHGRDVAAAIAKGHTWKQYAQGFLGMLEEFFDYRKPKDLKVSVLIPNYNYAPYLPKRIESILAQTRLPDEIVFLDNNSEDDSADIARRYAQSSPVPFRVVVNEVNNGCTFKQWLRGFGLVTGDLVWIAESDDWCEPDFLERLVPEFYDGRVRLAFAQSAVAGPEEQIFAPDYHHYTDELSKSHWRSWYCVPAEEEVALALSQKNTIPNASAVVFRRPDVSAVEPNLLQYRLCGDWWFYSESIRGGHIAFVPQVLNYHRRHPKTVTHNIEKDDRAILEALAVKRYLFETFKIDANMMCRGLASAVHEYFRLTVQHGLKRPPLTANFTFTKVLDNLYRLIHPKGKEKGLRILTVLPDMEIGGGQTAAIRLANAFAKDHTSFLVNARPALFDPLVAEMVDSDVLLLEGTLEMTPWAAQPCREHNPNQLAEGEARISVLRELLAFHKVDVVISHVWWADRLAYEVTRNMALPWFIRMHGCYEGLSEHADWDPEFKDLAQPMLRNAARVIYSTRRNLDVFNWAGQPVPQSAIQLFNGFDAAEVPSAQEASRRRADEFLFGLCSRAIPEKGWEEAIEAVRLINSLPADERGGRRARLLLIGGGAYADDLAERFAGEPGVEFLGAMTRVVDVVAQCDAGLLPSRFLSESLPSTLIEYFACGIPAITTDVGSIPDMVSADGRDAALVLPLDGRLAFTVAELASLMLRYMVDDALYVAHKNNTRYVFDSKFNIWNIADMYAACIKGSLPSF